MFPALALAAILNRDPVLVCAVAGEAERRGIDPVTVVALVEHESNFRARARGATHDYGLMQIHEPIHGRHREPAANIKKGVDILSRELARERGDMRRALSRYNTGRVCRRGLAYADKILTIASGLREGMGGERRWYWHGCYAWLSQSDCWYGWWCPDYDPRRRRMEERRNDV